MQPDPTRRAGSLFARLRTLVVPALILLIIALSFAGYHQELGKDFNFWGVLYSTIGSIIMGDNDPAAHNWMLVAARFLALLLLGAGLLLALRKRMERYWLLRSIRRNYKDHAVVYGLSRAGIAIAESLLLDEYKVVVVVDGSDDKDAASIELLRAHGASILTGIRAGSAFLRAVNMAQAKVCFLTADDDNENLEWAQVTGTFIQGEADRLRTMREQPLKIIPLVHSPATKNVAKDYFEANRTNTAFDIELFSIEEAAAQNIYDLYRPDKYFYSFDKDAGNSIAIIGWNATAEAFLLENLILDQYPGPMLITIYLVDANADTILADFIYRHPFCADFINIVAVRLLNGAFYANFAWSKESIEKLAQVKAAYFFGNKDDALIQTANSFRQFLYAQTLSLSTVPLVICLPGKISLPHVGEGGAQENNETLRMLKDGLNISYYHLIQDTFSSQRIIAQTARTDSTARLINYFYSISYDFAAIAKAQLGRDFPDNTIAGLKAILLQPVKANEGIDEKEIEQAVLRRLADVLGENIPVLQRHFSILSRWNSLTYRKRDSNRYAARHIPVKLHFMKWMQCWPLNTETITAYYPRLAPVEHARWSAEKQVFGFKYGPLPPEKNARHLAKEVLKIHNQIIGYGELTEAEKGKDLDLYLLVPVLRAIRAKS